MAIPIVVGVLRMIPKGLVRRQEEIEIGEAETIQTTALLTLDKILRRLAVT